MALTGPTWQVDVPSLTQLVMNIGAAGLKQLANSGVDIHTIACMLKVAELVPACHEFRRDLSTVRKKQREKQFWLYSVIEIGTATNFPVDLLLKTRAGENVLSLISAMAPMIPYALCVKALERVFELRKAAPDDIPSISQLRSLCVVLAAFNLDMDIKDKVLKYAAFFNSVMLGKRQKRVEVGNLINDGLPDTDSLAQVIVSLHDIMGQGHQEDSVLIWPGVRGAAWLAVYAARILGLPTCALGPDGEVPINSAYISARVILDLRDTTSIVRTFRRASASEITELFGLPVASDTTIGTDSHYAGSDLDPTRWWQFDCSEVDYLALHFSKELEPSLYSCLSDVIAATALRTLHQTIRAMWQRTTITTDYPVFPKRFSPMESVLGTISTRLLAILKILGFRVLPIEKYAAEIYEGFTVYQTEVSVSPIPDEGYSCYFAKRWKLVVPDLSISDPSLPEALANISKRTILLAIALAFTDWIDSWRKLPLGVVKYSEAKTVMGILSSTPEKLTSRHWISRFDLLLVRTLDLDTNKSWKISGADAVAFRLPGITFLRSCVDYRDRSWTKGIFYRIVCGTTRSQNTAFRYIVSEYPLHRSLQASAFFKFEETQEKFRQANTKMLTPPKATIRPEIQGMSFADGSSVHLRLQFFIGSQYQGSINCLNVLDMLPTRFVSLSCGHDVDAACYFPVENKNYDPDNHGDEWIRNLDWQFDGRKAFFTRRQYGDEHRIEAWFAPSSGCLETQWALCAIVDKDEEPGFERVVLRIDTCISCVLQQIAQRFGTKRDAEPPYDKRRESTYRILVISLDTHESANTATINGGG